MSLVPRGYVKFKSTPLFNKQSVPPVLLDKYTTQTGIYGQIQVHQGELRFVGLKDGAVDKELIIKAHETAISHPKYWHRIELLSEDTQFQIHYYAHQSLLQAALSKTSVQQSASLSAASGS